MNEEQEPLGTEDDCCPECPDHAYCIEQAFCVLEDQDTDEDYTEDDE